MSDLAKRLRFDANDVRNCHSSTIANRILDAAVLIENYERRIFDLETRKPKPTTDEYDSADEIDAEIHRLLEMKIERFPQYAKSLLEGYATKVEVFDHMIKVAQAAGFESLTEAISVAKKSHDEPIATATPSDEARDAARYRWLVKNCFDWAAPGDGDSFDHIELHFEHDLLSRDDDSVGVAIDSEIFAESPKAKSK